MRTTLTNDQVFAAAQDPGSDRSKGPLDRNQAGQDYQAPRNDLTPRLWLHFNCETWSGRGRPAKAFIAWEGTVAHTEWKKRHRGERFPAYPA